MKLRLLVTLESVDTTGPGFDDPFRVTQENAAKRTLVMNRAEFRGASSDAEHQEAINAMVGGLIAKRGYYSKIEEQEAAENNQRKKSLADPDNSEKMRDFDMWAYA